MTGQFCPARCAEDHKHHWSSGVADKMRRPCSCGTCRAGQVAAEESEGECRCQITGWVFDDCPIHPD